MICLANSISVAPPPGTRRLSCEQTIPKCKVLLKASHQFLLSRIYILYQEVDNRTLFHADLLRICFRTNMHCKRNSPEFTHSFQMSLKKNSFFCKKKIKKKKKCSGVCVWVFLFVSFKKRNFSSLLTNNRTPRFSHFFHYLVGKYAGNQSTLH